VNEFVNSYWVMLHGKFGRNILSFRKKGFNCDEFKLGGLHELVSMKFV
jgi:hypothetical protein